MGVRSHTATRLPGPGASGSNKIFVIGVFLKWGNEPTPLGWSSLPESDLRTEAKLRGYCQKEGTCEQRAAGTEDRILCPRLLHAIREGAGMGDGEMEGWGRRAVMEDVMPGLGLEM